MIRITFAKIVSGVIALYVALAILPGFSVEGGIFTVCLASVILTLVNIFVKPLLKLVTLPFIFLSMGLFKMVINAVLLWLVEISMVALALQPQFTFLSGMTLNFGGWWDYLLAGLIVSVVDCFTHWLLKVK